jgi:hypothetical protein
MHMASKRQKGTPSLNIKEVQFSNFIYEAPKKNKNGGLSINILYKYPDGKVAPLRIQTPRMRLPFGFSIFVPKKAEEKQGISATVSFSFQGMDIDSNIEALYQLVNSVDRLNLEKIEQNALEWLGKKKSKEILEELYSAGIKPPPEGKDYASTFRTKVLSWNDKINTKFFDSSKEPIAPTECAPGSEGVGLVELSKLWIGPKEFGVTWNCLQVKCYESDRPQHCAIQEDEDEEEQEENEEYVQSE